MRKGKNVIVGIVSSVTIWLIVGIVGAVLVQAGWSYYQSNKGGIGEKFRIDPVPIANSAKKLIDETKKMALRKLGTKNNEKHDIADSDSVRNTPVEQKQDDFTTNDVFKRLSDLADPDAKETTVSNSPERRDETESSSSKERNKSVTDRQIRLISELINEK